MEAVVEKELQLLQGLLTAVNPARWYERHVEVRFEIPQGDLQYVDLFSQIDSLSEMRGLLRPSSYGLKEVFGLFKLIECGWD